MKSIVTLAARLRAAAVPTGLPPSLYWLAAGQVVDSLGSGLVFPLTTLFVVQVLGRDLTWAGSVLFFHSLAATLGAALGGRLADAHGRKPVLLASLAGAALCSLVIGWRQEAALYAAAMAVFGLVISLFRPASQALVSDLAPGRERQVFGLIYMASNVGVAAGAALGGIVAAWSFRAVFWVDALTYAVFALVLAKAVPDPYGQLLRARRRRARAATDPAAPRSKGHQVGAGGAGGDEPAPAAGTPAAAVSAAQVPAGGAGAPEPGSGPVVAAPWTPAPAVQDPAARPHGGRPWRPAVPPRSPRSPWGTRLAVWHRQGLLTVVLLAVASAFLFFPYAQLHTALPVDMTRHGFSEAAYGLLWTLNALLVVVSTPVASTWADRRGWTLDDMLKGSAALHGAGFALLLVTAVWPAYAAFALAMVVITAGEVLHAISFNAAVARAAPEDRRGSYQGLAGTLAGGAWMVGPLAGGAIVDRFGIHVLWTVTVAVALAALGVFWLAEAVESARRRASDAAVPTGSMPQDA
ncbi:MFS transporter [Thermaerobacter sp. PB12/4term]|uniref:MFS transporter n=1 Tax=Thermaerobacter sp. PB12/4term TaxID=2293838 RepID=UPI000E32AB97|nr:MFS transporter [Thermaerobacter sp. PB12/4term]QIA27548.1 MFS transporter [Thermaerobacter sp. PB12/4term]